MNSRAQKGLTEKEKKLFEEILQMLLDIFENRPIDPENERNVDDLYYWFQVCKEARSSLVFTEGSRILNCQNHQESDRLMSQLRNHMLLHKWQDALNVLEVLSKTPLHRSHYVLLRVGLELIYRLKCGSQCFDSLADFVKKDSGGGLEEILIDLFNFNLINRLPEGISKENGGSVVLNDVSDLVAVNVKKNVKPKNQTLIEISSELMHNYYYPGLVAYANWNVARLKLRDDEGVLSEEEWLEELKRSAEKAVRYFSECEKYEGVWEVVVSKHVEILEHHASLERNPDLLVDAKDVLRDYEESCGAADLNALKMTYRFYQRNVGSFGGRPARRALVKICRRCPYDALVLDLVSSDFGEEEEEEGGGNFSRLELLFDLLDHSIWKDTELPWGMLAEEMVRRLADLAKREAALGQIGALWESRRDWWPEYHFQEWTGFESVGLDLCKAAVALVLMGKRCPFYRSIIKATRDSTVVSGRFELLGRARALGLSLAGTARAPS